MKLGNHCFLGRTAFMASMFVLAAAALPAFAQKQGAAPTRPSPVNVDYLNQPLVEDWSTSHIVFSDPGSQKQAVQNGNQEEWERVVSNPRYRMQWVKQYAAAAGLVRPAVQPVLPRPVKGPAPKNDWSIAIGGSIAFGKSPAKFTLNPLLPPNCSKDFVVFALTSGNQGQNLVGFNNMYETTCKGTVPNTLFVYKVAARPITNSPVISMDGTKVALVESATGETFFHIITLDKSGSSGCETLTTPCNGDFTTGPVFPCTVIANGHMTKVCNYNSAVDRQVRLDTTGSDTFSSPFIDYVNDIAYVGDDVGLVHKITGVFLGTPTEVIIPGMWPNATPLINLTSPVFDNTSGFLWIAGFRTSDHNSVLERINPIVSPPFDSSIEGLMLDGPIVDSTRERIYTASNGNNGSNTELLLNQFFIPPNNGLTAGMTDRVAPMGGNVPTGGMNAYNGALDHAYLTTGTGHMYFCGSSSAPGTAAIPTLMRVAIAPVGSIDAVMDTEPDPATFPLAIAPSQCSGATEFFKPSVATPGVDYLYLSVDSHSEVFGDPALSATYAFDLPLAAPFTFPDTFLEAVPHETPTSDFIIDNFSNLPGTFNVYYSADSEAVQQPVPRLP